MAFDFTPTGLEREFNFSERQNNRRLSIYDQLRRSYHTPFFSSERGIEDDGDSTYAPENHYFVYASWVVPQLVYGKPRVRVGSKKLSPDDPSQMEAQAGEVATNRWVRDTDFLTVQDQLALDPLFGFGAALVTQEADPTAYGGKRKENARRPQVQRISPRNFGRDPLSLTAEEGQYYWHRWVMHKEDLVDMAEELEDDGWNPEECRNIGESGVSENYRPRHNAVEAPDRKEVEMVEFWFPDFELEDDNEWGVELNGGIEEGFKGTIFTLAIVRVGDEGDGTTQGESKSESIFPRQPRQYYGHPSGPYAHCGVMRVPDDPYPLAPLVAVEGQIRDLNRHTRGASESAQRYKRQVWVDSEDPEIAQRVQYGEHDLVVKLPALGNKRIADMVQGVEIGGITEQNLAYINIAMDRLWRNAGMGEAQTGRAAQNTTATAVAVANQESDLRLERVKEMWVRFMNDILRKVNWYIVVDEDTEVVLNIDDLDELGQPPPEPGTLSVFQGGGLTPADYANYELEVDVSSMQRNTEQVQQARVMQAHQSVLEALPMIVQFPVTEFWVEHFDKLGDALNMPHLGEHIAPLIEAALSGMATAAQPAEPAPQAPRMDVAGNKLGAPFSAGNAGKPQLPSIGQQQQGGAPQLAGNTSGAQLGGAVR